MVVAQCLYLEAETLINFRNARPVRSKPKSKCYIQHIQKNESNEQLAAAAGLGKSIRMCIVLFKCWTCISGETQK